MEKLEIQDLWEREAYDTSGHHLGRIEAIGIGRDRVPRRVGVRSNRGRALRFLALAGASLHDGIVIVEAPELSLLVLPGGPA